MHFADRFGLTCGPLVLRVLLAATFLWAGLGKVLSTTPVNPDQAARLAEMGVAVTSNTPVSPGPQTDSPATPSIQIPDPETVSPDLTEPAQDDENADDTNTGSPLEEVSWSWQPETQAPTTPDASSTPIAAHSASPDHFPEGGTVRALHQVSLLIDHAANPGLSEESEPIPPIWPASMAGGSWPVAMAWTVTISELGFGLMLLIGLLTRLAALGVVVTMGTAAWLTVVGPAIQAGHPALGFLPNHDIFDIPFWQGFAWQLSLLTMGLALLCLGSGPIGLDRALFRRHEIAFDPGPTPEIPGAADIDAPRGPFDRSVEDDHS